MINKESFYHLNEIVSNAVKDAFNATYQNAALGDYYPFLASANSNDTKDTKEKYPFVSSYQEDNWNRARREEQISLDDFTYKLTENKEIVVEHPFSTPTSLYKFYSSSDFSIDAFTNHYLHASAPIVFNDILDSSWLLFDFRNITPNEYQKFYTKPGREYTPVGYERDKAEEFSTLRFHWFLCYSSQVGLISMTSSLANPLMWAHYTQESGFAVEYDPRQIKNNLLTNNTDILECHYAPIQYLPKLQPLDFFSREFKTPTIPMTCITNLKLNNWGYEKEWRISIRKKDMGITTGVASRNIFNRQGLNDRKCHYSLDCVKAVYLSAYFLGSTYFEHSDTETLVVKPKYIPFLHYLFENHNNHLYFCGGDCTPNNEVKRSYQQVQLLRKEINQFEIKFFPEVYFFNE